MGRKPALAGVAGSQGKRSSVSTALKGEHSRPGESQGTGDRRTKSKEGWRNGKGDRSVTGGRGTIERERRPWIHSRDEYSDEDDEDEEEDTKALSPSRTVRGG